MEKLQARSQAALEPPGMAECKFVVERMGTTAVWHCVIGGEGGGYVQ